MDNLETTITTMQTQPNAELKPLERANQEKWDRRFLRLAANLATWSKDPNTKVGCLIMDNDRNQLAGGYNGLPRGVVDNERLVDREMKLKIVVHAEANAVAGAARNGHSLKGGIAYITFPPCSQCAALLIQAGVVRVVYYRADASTKWAESQLTALQLLTEAGVGIKGYDVI